jgi:hypothetical protein
VDQGYGDVLKRQGRQSDKWLGSSSLENEKKHVKRRIVASTNLEWRGCTLNWLAPMPELHYFYV